MNTQFGQSNSHSLGANSQQPQQLLSGHMAGIEDGLTHLDKLAQRVQKLADQLVGVEPTPLNNAASNVPPVPAAASVVGRFGELRSSLRYRLVELESAVSRLERL